MKENQLFGTVKAQSTSSLSRSKMYGKYLFKARLCLKDYIFIYLFTECIQKLEFVLSLYTKIGIWSVVSF